MILIYDRFMQFFYMFIILSICLLCYTVETFVSYCLPANLILDIKLCANDRVGNTLVYWHVVI